MTSYHGFHPRSPQRGAASLLVTVLLCAALLLATLFSHRGALLEARLSSQQTQSARAFEAAEAGIEWALAQLNRPEAVDASCQVAATGTSFRDRHLVAAAASAASETAFVPRTWSAAGVATPQRAACVRAAIGWRCHCPSDAPVTLAEAEGSAIAPAFRIHLETTGAPGVLRLVSTGCTRATAACLTGGAAPTGTDATARVQVDLALVPALLSAPAAPLVARGDIRSAATLSLVNPDARSGGVVAHSGGAIDLPQATFETPAGSSLANALAEQDTAFGGQSPDALFVSLFGVAKPLWRELPMVHRVSCAASCADELFPAIAQSTGAAQVWVEGDLALSGPLSLGSAERPVVLVVSGQLALQGDVQLHGVVYANGVTWNAAGSAPAALRGALVSETSYSGDAPVTLSYDPRVFDTLRQVAGSFVRVPGSWRDF